jgi:putative flippase GtrA
MIGVFCVSLDWTVFYFEIYYLKLSPAPANLVSSHVGIFSSYFLNTTITFRGVGPTVLRFTSFYAVGFLGYLFGQGFLSLGMLYTDVRPEILKGLSYIGIFVIQFSMNKLVTFGNIGDIGDRVVGRALRYIVRKGLFGLPVNDAYANADADHMRLTVSRMEPLYRVAFTILLTCYAGLSLLFTRISLGKVGSGEIYRIARHVFPFPLVLRWLRNFYILSATGAERG